MKRIVMSVAALVFSLSSIAIAEEITFATATVTKIELKDDSATVTVKDKSSGTEANMKVMDQPNLAKLKDKRISTEDEIRVKFDHETGIVKVFKKIGC